MKKRLQKSCTLLSAVLLMASVLAACRGKENPFLGAWDDDANEQSFTFYEDGTGESTSYYGTIPFTFDGAGTFGYSNNEIGEGGSGVYTYDGYTLSVTILQDGEEVTHEGSVRDEDYAVYISLWDDDNIYYDDSAEY